jgi:hypothetical protein
MPLAGEILTASMLSIGIVAAPVSTSANGTPTPSGGAETFDTVLGYYQAAVISGHRYRVCIDGLIGNCGTASDVYLLQIRDSGSASNPTTSSTLVAQVEWTSAQSATASRIPIFLANTFVAFSTGTHTFGFSAQRTSGSGVFTPVSSPNGFREMYITDLGGN